MKKVLLAAAAYNWAETHRMATIGQTFKKQGWKVYTLGEGKYEALLEEDMERIKLNADDKWYTDERIYKLMHMDDCGNDYCNEEELESIVQEEVSLLQELSPQVVITGYRTTLKLSCKIAHIPLVWVLSAVISPMYYKKGLASMPSRSPLNFVKNIQDVIKQREYYSRLALKNAGTSHIWNQVAKAHDIKPLKSDIEIFEGDFNLMSDVPELFSELNPLPNNYCFCGPLLNTQVIQWPKIMKTYVDTGKKKIFVTMGSSGEEYILMRILNLLKEVDADIFISTTSIMSDKDHQDFPSNFYFAEAFPHVEMASLVDLSIIHGGQGTIYATIMGGKPYIGIPMFSEQQYNLENLEKFRCGKKLLVSELETSLLLQDIKEVTSNLEYQRNMEDLRSKISSYCEMSEENNGGRAVRQILKFIGENV